jgi:O-antigen/teichoic acid export membrane protein
MRWIKRFIPAGEFKKNVMVLLTGTVIAQAIPIAISPILTRLFSPEDFGLLAFYMAICSIMAVAAGGRYDLAIIEPKEEKEAKHLVVGSLILTFIFSLFIFIVILLFNKQITVLLRNPEISNWLYFVPVSIMLISVYSIFTYWLNRQGRYKDMSINRVTSSGSTTLMNLALGVSKLKIGSLLIGYIFGQLITVVLLIKKIMKDGFSYNKKEMIVVLKKYNHYPKYLIASTFAGEASAQVPIILLSSFFGVSISGFFSLANRVIVLPLTIIGNAIGEVYRKQATNEFNENGNCLRLYLKTIASLAIVGFLPLIVLLFFSEPLFAFVFGEKWRAAGTFASYLSFVIFFQLVSTPTSYTIVFIKGQKIDLILQIARATLAIGSILIGWYFKSYKMAILLYAISYCLYYIGHSLLQYKAAKGLKTDL